MNIADLAVNSTDYYWLVTSKSEGDLLKAKLTLAGGLLSLVACLITVIIYFSMHRNSTVFNSMNHFFAFAFALGVISSINYIASALIRLYSNDVELLKGFCDISAVHVLISTYPMLLCELGYFIAAFKRLSGAYDLGKKQQRQTNNNKTNNKSNNINNNNLNEENVDAAIEIVDSGESFFRNFIGGCLFVCLVTAMAFKAALPVQLEYDTKFSPSDQTWCWIPTKDGDGDDDEEKGKRELLYILFQLFVEVVPLIGTPVVGIASLVLLYRALGNQLPRSAKIRIFYIVIFLVTFSDSIFVRLQFSSSGASRFQAFAEPCIAFMNAITFLISEIYPVYVASKPRTLNSEDRNYEQDDNTDIVYGAIESNNSHPNNDIIDVTSGRNDNEWKNDESTSLLPDDKSKTKKKRDNNNNNNNKNGTVQVANDEESYQPSLAVAIEAGAFLRSALNQVSGTNLHHHHQNQKKDDNEENDSSSTNNNNGQTNEDEDDNDNASTQEEQQQQQNEVSQQQRQSLRISQKLQEHSLKQRDNATMTIVTLLSFLNGLCDVWCFVSFGTFSMASVGANVGVCFLAIAYSKWMPAYISTKVEVTHHITLSILSIAVPVLVAAVVTRLIVRENKIIERRHSMIILGASVLVLCLTWTGSLSFFSINWFDATFRQRTPAARYIAIIGISAFSGLQLAYHRMFLTLFKLPSEPVITSTLLDVVAGDWLTPSAQVILTAASAERFPTQLRKKVQSASTLAYLIGAAVSLVSGIFEASGVFGTAPILSGFVLLLTLDWSVLDDEVLIPTKNSILGSRRNNNNNREGEDHNENRINYSSLMFAREIEGLNQSDDATVGGKRSPNSETRLSWKPASISTGMTPRATAAATNKT